MTTPEIQTHVPLGISESHESRNFHHFFFKENSSWCQSNYGAVSKCHVVFNLANLICKRVKVCFRWLVINSK